MNTEMNICEATEHRFTEKELLMLLSSMNNMILVLDNQRTFLSCFLSGIANLFFPKEFLIGRHFSKIGFPEPAFSILSKVMDDVEKENRTREAEYYLPFHGGTRWFSCNVSLIPFIGNNNYTFLITVKDITHLKENEEKLKKQNKELAEIAFVQSHIIRAPVSNIEGILNLIDTENLNAINQKYFTILKECVNKLDEVITKTVHAANMNYSYA